MSNSSIDTQEMVRLYVEEQRSVRDIATRFGRSYGRIYNLLRTRVIMRTSHASRPDRDMEYAKIATTMREHIVGGDWPPGCKLLPQTELAKLFDVPLQTIRYAIADLRQHRYLTTMQHRGTYVRPPQDWKAR